MRFILAVLLSLITTTATAQTRVSQDLALIVAGATANTTATVPIGHAVRDIFVRNNTANAITGGIKIGTTSGGIDVVVALTVGANAFTVTTPLVRLFSATATQTLFIQAVTAWNSANVDIVITMERAIP